LPLSIEQRPLGLALSRGSHIKVAAGQAGEEISRQKKDGESGEDGEDADQGGLTDRKTPNIDDQTIQFMPYPALRRGAGWRQPL
jgi:hypothetical protein